MTVLVYLAAIVAANVAAAAWGPSVTVASAFLLVGLDLTLRDKLHVEWAARGVLAPRMGLLIMTAGALSYVATPGAGPIAVASAVAWAVASAADAFVFHVVVRRAGRDTAVHSSNVVGAAIDSVLFPTLAFGAVLPLVVLGQFAAKVAGGALWLGVIRAVSQRRQAA